MTPEEILEVDVKRNQPFGVKVGNLIAQINDHLRNGGNLVCDGNVLIVYSAKEPGNIEYHTFNADTPENLYKAVRKFMLMLKKAGAETAFTTYENEKINKLFELGKKEFDIDITKNDGVFTSVVRL